MATGGGFPRLKQSKSETKQRSSNWPRSVSSDKDDSLSLTSFPSDIRINNWDLSDLRPTASADSRRRKKSKGNPEREREQSLSMDSPPHGEPKQRTPSSMSRTRNTPTAQRDALEKLKQKLTYDEDQYSTDGERNNERSLPRSRRRHANNREAEGATGGSSGAGSRSRSNRNNNTDHGPDRNQIVGRLVQIQDYIKQATSMMETLQKSGDSGNTEDLAKVGRLIANLQEQEQGYLGLLHTNAMLRAEAAAEGGSEGQPVEGAAKQDSDSEKSLDLEVESVTSENTENTSSSRPRIEDKLGLGSDEERGSDDSKDEDTAMDNTMMGPDIARAEAMATRNVQETLNSLTEREDMLGATGDTDLTSQQRQQLMRIMMEKQEQLRQLQSRQDQLLSMKREAEVRLKQAQERDNQARAALAAVEAGQAALEEDGAFLDQAAGQLKSNIVGYPESDDDETSNAREGDPLMELQRQLSFLRNEFSAETEQRPRNNTDGSSGGGSGVVGATVALDQQQQQLQDKLKDLQQKKRHMDQLLAQLETLRSQRLTVMNNEASASRSLPSPLQQQPPQLPPPPSLSQPPPVPSAPQAAAAAAAVPPSTRLLQQAPRDLDSDMASMLSSYLGNLGSLSEMMGDGVGGRGEEGGLSGWQAAAEQGDTLAGTALSMQEAENKLEKLQEVRQRLNQLRDLVQYYQKMKTQPAAEDGQLQDVQSDVAERDSLSGLQAMEETLRRGLPLSGLASGASRSSMGSGGPPPEGAFMQIQEAQASAASEEQSDEDNASASEDGESGMGAWDRDPEVQEKVRQLMKAKDKLRDLQSLIAAIESMPEGETLGDMSQNSSTRPRQTRDPVTRTLQATQTDDGVGEGGNASVSEGEVPGAESQGGERRDVYLQQQMGELTRLREERERLLALQLQLRTLQDRFETERVEAEGTETQPEVSARKEEGQPPSTSVVTFASNDELYSKMRDQRIEREELRSKKRELEAIMKKDQNRRQYIRNQDNHSDTVSYTTGTDAFGASASADATMATWGGSTVDNLENITEDEDAQDGNTRPEDEDDGYPSDGIVQVEEEEEENETDNGTYTIGTDGRQQRGIQQVRGQGARPKTSRGRRGFPQPVKATGTKKTSSKRPQSQPWGRVPREEKTQSRQIQRGSQVSVDGAGDDAMMQQFRQQVERMSYICQNLMASPASSSGRSNSKTPTQLAAVAPSADLVTPTQPDMQSQMLREMQQQQLMMAVTQCNQQLMMQQNDMAWLSRQLQQLTNQMAHLQTPSPSAPEQRPAPVQPVLMSQPYLSPLSSTLAAHVPNNVSTSVNVQSSRQTTFTVNPNFTSNPFTVADPQHFPMSQAVQTANLDGQSEAAKVSCEGVGDSSAGNSFPRPMRLWEETNQSDDRGRHSQPSDTVPKMNLQSFLKARRKKNARKHTTERSTQSVADYERSSRYRPGLSAGISGTGFNDVASMSSLSSQTEGAVGGQAAAAEPEDLGELNLFEELRETIYTEVATLISQNESRPQYLLSLFRELQGLTSDLMRQRAIFALQEIVQTTLKTEVENSREAWQPWKTGQDGVTGELTPSESLLTSDDEEVKQARVRQHASALERKKQKQRGWGMARGSSLKNDKFDYVEAAVTTSSLSTPTNDVGESPFSRDSLGDTVIHLDKALAKMRKEMQQAEQERAERAQNVGSMDTHQDLTGDAGLGDQGSESSISDMPYPRINTQELDKQIKGVMGQVIPVIKEHINDVFSPQLLAYIQRLVLSLVRQPGHTHEFARFFYGQLASILQNSLAKFEGRRVREVGEDVLLDMSEVLFNELAFLRIMRDLDDPTAFERMRSKPLFSPKSSKRTSAVLVGEDDDAGGNESDNEASDDKDDDDVTPQNLKVNGMDDEEEELGKERDDELARKLVTQTGSEKDDDTEDPHSSAVHIQLAMSETKPFTRIGSDEDTEGSDASLSLEDPSDTAVSRSAMMEHRQDTAQPTASASTGAAATGTPPAISTTTNNSSPAQQKEASSDMEEKEADTSEADGTLDSRGPADGSRGNTSTASTSGEYVGGGGDASAAMLVAAAAVGMEENSEEIQVNGHAASPQDEVEVTLADLPSVLNVADPETVDQKRQDEEAATSGVAAILNSMEVGEELAGDGSALKEPDSASK